MGVRTVSLRIRSVVSIPDLVETAAHQLSRMFM